jgi:predicted RecA/RadA family phage recombinase
MNRLFQICSVNVLATGAEPLAEVLMLHSFDISVMQNAPGNAMQSSMNGISSMPQPNGISWQTGVNNYQQSPSNSLQQSGVTVQNGSSVTSLPNQSNAIQQQMLKQQQEQQQQQLLQAQQAQQHRLMQQQVGLFPSIGNSVMWASS